jgi:type IV pilus assembly protein PilX
MSINLIRVSQQGMALIICLIFLMIISVAGMTVLNVSNVEERLAAATRDKDLAFQAAEMSIIKAEQVIESTIFNTLGFTQDCTAGLCAPIVANTVQMRWENPNFCATDQNVWQCEKSQEYDIQTLTGGGFAKNPRFILEHLNDYILGDDLMLGNLGENTGQETVHIFRITSIGYGGTSDAQVMLQSTYGKKL